MLICLSFVSVSGSHRYLWRVSLIFTKMSGFWNLTNPTSFPFPVPRKEQKFFSNFHIFNFISVEYNFFGNQMRCKLCCRNCIDTIWREEVAWATSSCKCCSGKWDERNPCPFNKESSDPGPVETTARVRQFEAGSLDMLWNSFNNMSQVNQWTL